MSSHIGIAIPITDVARELQGEFDALFNELGYQYNGENKHGNFFFVRNIGRDLDDAGREFLVSLSQYIREQFPEDFK